MPEIKMSVLNGEYMFNINGKKAETCDIANEINSIAVEMVGEYLGEAGKFFTAAQSHFENADGNASDNIIKATIALIDAHNYMKSLINKTIEKRVLMIFKTTADAVENKLFIHNRCTRLSVVIHELYCILHNFDGVKYWYRKVLENIDSELIEFRYNYGNYHLANNHISHTAYNNLVSLSPAYANREIEETSRYVGYIPDHGEVYETDRTANYTMTQAGVKYCQQQESTRKNTALKKLNKSLKILPLSEKEQEKYRLTMLADYAFEKEKLWDAAVFKMENADLCRSQGNERDAHLLETSAYEYMIENYKSSFIRFFDSEFESKLDYIKAIPNTGFQEGLLNELIEIALENTCNIEAAKMKMRLAEICRAKGDDQSAKLLELDAEKLRTK